MRSSYLEKLLLTCFAIVALCILRIKRENVGARVQLDKISKKVALRSMTNATTLANAAVFFLGNLPVQGLGMSGSQLHIENYAADRPFRAKDSSCHRSSEQSSLT